MIFLIIDASDDEQLVCDCGLSVNFSIQNSLFSPAQHIFASGNRKSITTQERASNRPTYTEKAN
jgi:hypothetical protein